MDGDYWTKDDCLTVLEQSPILEFALPPLNHLSLDGIFHNQPQQTVAERRVSSIRDSVSSAISPEEDHNHSISLKKENKSKNNNEEKNKKNSSLNNEDKKEIGGRSWSGSPDWDFKEGCSYIVPMKSDPEGFAFINTLMERDFHEEFMPLSGLRSSMRTKRLREISMRNNTSGKECADSLKSLDISVLDSAFDVQSSRYGDDLDWGWLHSSSFSTSSLAKTSETFSIPDLSARNDEIRISLDQYATRRERSSFLSRVRNEIDIESWGGHDPEYDDDVDSFGNQSLPECHGSMTDHRPVEEDHPKSTLGRVLSLVVGIGVGAVFQIMK